MFSENQDHDQPLFFLPLSDDIRDFLFFIFFLLLYYFLIKFYSVTRKTVNTSNISEMLFIICVTTNHSKDQGTPTSYKTTKSN